MEAALRCLNDPSDRWHLHVYLSITCRYHWNSVFSLASNSLVPPEKRAKGYVVYADCAKTWKWCALFWTSQDYKHFSTLTVFRDVYNNLVTVRIRGKLPVNSFALTSACPEQWYLCLSVAISLYAKPLWKGKAHVYKSCCFRFRTLEIPLGSVWM